MIDPLLVKGFLYVAWNVGLQIAHGFFVDLGDFSLLINMLLFVVVVGFGNNNTIKQSTHLLASDPRRAQKKRKTSAKNSMPAYTNEDNAAETSFNKVMFSIMLYMCKFIH